MKKKNYFVLALAAAGLLMACGGNDKKEDDVKVRNVMTVLPLNRYESSVKNFSGVVNENSTVSMSFRTPGQIASIYVKEGAHADKWLPRSTPEIISCRWTLPRHNTTR